MSNQFSNRKRMTVLITLYILGIVVVGFRSEIYRTMSGIERMNLPTANEIRTDDTVRRVWNSGLWADPDSSQPIFWVNESTLLFRANKDPKPRTIVESKARKEWLYLWKLDEKPQPHGADPVEAAVAYCGARGNVSYHQNIIDQTTGEKKRIRLIGPPGQEREAAPRELPDEQAGPASYDFQKIPPSDCEWYSDVAMAGMTYVTDPDHRFYVVLGRRHEHEERPYELLRADKAKRVILQIPREDKTIQYDIITGDFLIYQNIFPNDPRKIPDDFQAWRKSNCLPIWRVEPETANIERTCIPYGAWVGDPPPEKKTGAIIELVPTKAGLFFIPSALGRTRPLQTPERVCPPCLWRRGNSSGRVT